MGILEQQQQHPLLAIKHYERVLERQDRLPYDAAAEANWLT